MKVKEIFAEVSIMLSALYVKHKVVSLGRNLPDVAVVGEFGTVVIGINAKDYSFVSERVNNDYKGYRTVYISSTDNLLDKKDELLWALMRSGYIRYIRQSFPNQFSDLICRYGIGRKIIKERVRVWGDSPKYEYLVHENLESLNMAEHQILTLDTSFFDYMPEEY